MRSLVVLLVALCAVPATGQVAAPTVPAAPLPVLTGIDVLRASGFTALEGRRVALLTNLSARARTGELTLDLLRSAANVSLVALFAPEHGLTALQDAKVASGRDARTGLPVHSLYGETQRPTPAMLEGLDVIVIDLPDVGARFYTYITTTAYVLEEAGRAGVAVIVLDRPNPINGADIEGPLLDEDLASFVGYFPMPVRHGMTLGELARLFNEERALGAELTVVEAQGWTRDRWFDETGLPWANPSPNIRTLAAATLYPGLGAIEWSNISVGRGTAAPFGQIGAPWIDGRALALMLTARRVPGVQFAETTFTPESSVYANQACTGVTITITDRNAVRPVRVGIEVATAIWRLHAGEFDFGKTVQLLGSRETVTRILRGEEPAVIAALWTADEARWRALRSTYLLY